MTLMGNAIIRKECPGTVPNESLDLVRGRGWRCRAGRGCRPARRPRRSARRWFGIPAGLAAANRIAAPRGCSAGQSTAVLGIE